MAKADLKTKKTEIDVESFFNSIELDERRMDAIAISKMMQKVSGSPPKMWGPAIIGFGDVHLKYESGRELDWFNFGFSPRKANFALYLSVSLDSLKDHLDQLGKYKTAKSCLYIQRLADVNEKVFIRMLKYAWEQTRK